MLAAFVVGAAYAALCAGLGFLLGFLKGKAAAAEEVNELLRAKDRQHREAIYGSRWGR